MACLFLTPLVWFWKRNLWQPLVHFEIVWQAKQCTCWTENDDNASFVREIWLCRKSFYGSIDGPKGMVWNLVFGLLIVKLKCLFSFLRKKLIVNLVKKQPVIWGQKQLKCSRTFVDLKILIGKLFSLCFQQYRRGVNIWTNRISSVMPPPLLINKPAFSEEDS